MDANDVSALAELWQSVVVRVHADGMYLIPLRFKERAEASQKSASAAGVGEDEVRVLKNEHPREMFDNKFYREAEHLAAPQGVLLPSPFSRRGESLAGGSGHI